MQDEGKPPLSVEGEAPDETANGDANPFSTFLSGHGSSRNQPCD
jgi:hypothetical protein